MLEGQGGIHQLQQAQLLRMLVTMLVLELNSLQPCAEEAEVDLRSHDEYGDLPHLLVLTALGKEVAQEGFGVHYVI